MIFTDKQLRCINEPEKYSINNNEIVITTSPHTDLWQKTYYKFINDNAPIEYENQTFQNLGSVVTNLGYSDWATSNISAEIKEIWYRLSRRESDFKIEYSLNGKYYSQMRICHLHKADNTISFGIYACSPENSSFEAVFSNMNIIECLWYAHDGQQPDSSLL